MHQLHIWKATGTDSRFPNGFAMIFDYDAHKALVVLTVQRQLGYQIHVMDTFPLCGLFNLATRLPDNDSRFVLKENVRAQTKANEEVVIPAGTFVSINMHGELLYSPAT